MQSKHLDQLILTEQQKCGLKDFRKAQEERENLKDDDFLDFYVMWQYEHGYFDDSALLTK